MGKKNSNSRNRLGMSARRKIRMLLSCIKDFFNGVDFTIPDRMYDRERNDGAMYYATPNSMLKKIFSFIDHQKHLGFLDIGSGKGYVLAKAWEYGFNKVGGVEYDEKLVGVCQKICVRWVLKTQWMYSAAMLPNSPLTEITMCFTSLTPFLMR